MAASELTDGQMELADLMEDASQEYWCAQWLDELEYILWGCVIGRQPKPMLSEWASHEERVRGLAMLSAREGGWIVWDDDTGRRFVPTNNWLSMYERWCDTCPPWRQRR